LGQKRTEQNGTGSGRMWGGTRGEGDDRIKNHHGQRGKTPILPFVMHACHHWLFRGPGDAWLV
jgi:hypothetical protein